MRVLVDAVSFGPHWQSRSPGLARRHRHGVRRRTQSPAQVELRVVPVLIEKLK